jgi:hypothetical protein
MPNLTSIFCNPAVFDHVSDIFAILGALQHLRSLHLVMLTTIGLTSFESHENRWLQLRELRLIDRTTSNMILKVLFNKFSLRISPIGCPDSYMNDPEFSAPMPNLEILMLSTESRHIIYSDLKQGKFPKLHTLGLHNIWNLPGLLENFLNSFPNFRILEDEGSSAWSCAVTAVPVALYQFQSNRFSELKRRFPSNPFFDPNQRDLSTWNRFPLWYAPSRPSSTLERIHVLLERRLDLI